jgi:hypothetical protein
MIRTRSHDWRLCRTRTTTWRVGFHSRNSPAVGTARSEGTEQVKLNRAPAAKPLEESIPTVSEEALGLVSRIELKRESLN